MFIASAAPLLKSIKKQCCANIFDVYELEASVLKVFSSGSYAITFIRSSFYRSTLSRCLFLHLLSTGSSLMRKLNSEDIMNSSYFCSPICMIFGMKTLYKVLLNKRTQLWRYHEFELPLQFNMYGFLNEDANNSHQKFCSLLIQIRRQWNYQTVYLGSRRSNIYSKKIWSSSFAHNFVWILVLWEFCKEIQSSAVLKK